MAARNLIVCADGTGNQAAKGRGTNVWKLYEAIDRHAEDRGGPVQLATHHDGVGTSTNKIMAILGGALGVGLAANVRQLYLWLCEHYTPGDRIFLFGFSRGAFTVRCLGGLIARCGLVDLDEAGDAAGARVTEAWRLYKRSQHVPAAVHEATRFRDACGIKLPPTGDEDPQDGSRVIPIHFIGVWDTVDAYGLPIDEVKEAVSLLSRTLLKIPWAPLHRFTLAEFGSFGLHPSVKWARHAIALDDERLSFHPMLWREDRRAEAHRSGPARFRPDPPEASEVDDPSEPVPPEFAEEGPTTRRTGERRGVQANGGIALERRSRSGALPQGLEAERREDTPRRRPESDRRRIQQVWFTGMHSDVGGGYARDSLSLVSLDWMMACAEAKGLWLEPFRRHRVISEMNPLGPVHNSRAGLANYYRYRPRNVRALCEAHGAAQPHIHSSVLHRIAATGEAPTVLPKDFAVATGRKLSLPRGRPTDEHRRLLGGIVWWRSLLYYLFLMWTVVVGWTVTQVLPASVSSPPPGWSFLGLGHMMSWAERASPAFAADWVNVLRNEPSTSLLFLGVLLCLLGASARLRAAEGRIARGGWEGVEPKGIRTLRPMLLKGNWWRGPTEALTGTVGRLVPFATLAVLAFVGVAGVRGALSGDPLLPPDSPPEAARASLPLVDSAGFHFEAGNPGLRVPMLFEAGERYRIWVGDAVPAAEDRSDPVMLGSADEFPQGVFASLMRPFKRRYGAEYSTLLGSWGSVNGEQFVITGAVTVTVPGHRNEDLYLYVNDLTCYFLCEGGGAWHYYRDNSATARIHIEKVGRPSGP